MAPKNPRRKVMCRLPRGDHELAERYYVHESSIRTGYGDLLSLLWWKDEKMLIALDEFEERQDSRRSDAGWR